jgi:sulfate/thiosulfate-binding protein
MTVRLDRRRFALAAGGFGLAALAGCGPASTGAKGSAQLLNVSYDPTRELYKDYNTEYAKRLKAQGTDLTVNQSHGGSGKQARSVIDGLEADVVTLALAYDIDEIADRPSCFLDKEWQSSAAGQFLPLHLDHRLPRPQGQPEGDQGLGRPGQTGRRGHHPQSQDLGRRALELPGRLGLGRATAGGRDATAEAFVTGLFRHVPVLDTGARGATNTFAQRGIGDVLLAWENEACSRSRSWAPTSSRSSIPSLSILAEPPVAWSTRSSTARAPAHRRGYLNFLYEE